MTISVYLVGGAIRDELLGVEPKDIDFSVEAASYDQMYLFISNHGGEIFQETPEFFTIRAGFKNGNPLGIGRTNADFVLCRKDGSYRDGRHPISVQVGTIFDDLSRRDFTVNAIARPVFNTDVGVIENGELYDPFGGISDIANRVLRTVNNPYVRFGEDSLRMLRALRFSLVKGFDIDPFVGYALRDARLSETLRTSVSTDRKREELEKMFKYSSIKTLRLLMEYPEIANAVLDTDEIWLKPTTQRR